MPKLSRAYQVLSLLKLSSRLKLTEPRGQDVPGRRQKQAVTHRLDNFKQHGRKKAIMGSWDTSLSRGETGQSFKHGGMQFIHMDWFSTMI